MIQTRRLLASLVSLGLALLSAPAVAQTNPNSIPFSLSAAGQTSPVLNCSNLSSAAVVVDNSGTGQTLVPQASSDPASLTTPGSVQWATVSTINSGSITTFGQWTGGLGGTGLVGFRVTLTALASGGPVTGKITCGAATPTSLTTTPGGTQNVSIVGQTLSPIVVSTPAPCTAATCTTAIGNGANTLAVNAAGKASVTCPANTDCPVNASQVGTWTVQPGNTPNTTAWLTAGSSATVTLTSASVTACTNLSATAIRVWSISNSGPATTVFPAFYNDTGTTCALATSFLGDATTITLGSGQTITFQGGLLLTGLAYKLSGALTAGQQLWISTGPP